MTAKEFVKGFWLEKESLIESAFNPNSGLLTTKLINEMQLDSNQEQQLKKLIDTLLTDTFYTILLGLDGEASIGKQQISYKIYDEKGHELTGSGEIEEYAYECFQENDEE